MARQKKANKTFATDKSAKFERAPRRDRGTEGRNPQKDSKAKITNIFNYQAKQGACDVLSGHSL